MSGVDFGSLCDDLQAEHDDLVRAMASIDDAAWDVATLAPGWTVRDQISHLAYFDDVTVTAITDPTAFEALLKEALRDLQGYVDRALESGRDRSPSDMLAWFAGARARLVAAFRQIDPTTKVPWFGPPMTAASKATARIMETWAHGQDIVDALALDRPATQRLQHVAHIGVRAFANSYRARGLEPPPADVRVELLGPDGDAWTWGDPSAGDRVSGSALDFCLVVTQRRHVADTRLVVEGGVAGEWMTIAQAFAGPPGEGRAAGQFAVTG